MTGKKELVEKDLKTAPVGKFKDLRRQGRQKQKIEEQYLK